MKVVANDKKCAPYAKNTIMGNVLPSKNSPIAANQRRTPPNQMLIVVVATEDPPEPCHPTVER